MARCERFKDVLDNSCARDCPRRAEDKPSRLLAVPFQGAIATAGVDPIPLNQVGMSTQGYVVE
jgi:hypothetical protein